ASLRRADGTVSATGRRRSSQPLVVVAQAARREDALAGLERWRERHADAAAHVRDPEDVLVDAMRGRFTVWWRVRVNLRNVPEPLRPSAEPPDPDYDPWAGVR
ncbi:MAG TPA: DNA polymerase domain-containing protein, partial [Candidatus Limnocylindria bacterium]|nr:DNA polymerase domain-containing protein [Candidatus Limnocylindria bacterium]